ncbi:hypothetical protein ACP70R_012062 [Stipagrostis hirtigluma subsp. patula]
MRLGRAVLPLVRTRTSTTSASSPPAVLTVGGAVLRERRRFTEADMAAYAAVSGDRNPVHLDDAVARGVGGFARGRVVHRMLVASLFPSVIATSLAFRRTPHERVALSVVWLDGSLVQLGAVYASQTLRFAAPVYVGDEVVAQVQALHIRKMAAAGSSATSHRYVVKFATKCFTNEEEGSLAIDGEAMAILPTLELRNG